MRPRRLERLGKAAAHGAAAALIGPRGSRDRAPTDVRRILVTKQHNQLGDFILATPLLSSLARGFPGAEIDYLANPLQRDAAKLVPEIDRVFVFEGRGMAQRGRAFAALVRALRARRYDLAISVVTVSYSTTSALLLALSGARYRVAGRIATSPAGRSLFHCEVPIPEAAHETDRALAHLHGAGVEVISRTPRMAVPEGDRRAARRTLLGGGAPECDLVIGLHPGAGKIPNRWPAPRFGELARRALDNPRARIALFAGPREAALVDAMGIPSGERVARLPHLSMRDLAAYMSALSLYVGNDTGTLHLAAALGVPTVGLFGPTDPAIWAPNSPRGTVLRSADATMESLTVDAVASCVRDRLLILEREPVA